jgi:hypothetical protein
VQALHQDLFFFSLSSIENREKKTMHVKKKNLNSGLKKGGKK